MAEMIASLADFARRRCGGKIAVVLEGGYDLEATAAGSAALAAGLLGEAPADPLGPSPTPDSDRWRDVLESQLRSFDL
jgi:acetoin utilization deacetylase AcuC-like enzyme